MPHMQFLLHRLCNFLKNCPVTSSKWLQQRQRETGLELSLSFILVIKLILLASPLVALQEQEKSCRVANVAGKICSQVESVFNLG